MGIILKARKFLNRKVLLQLYNSFVYPYLIYCVEIWGNAADIHLDPIIKMQKKIIRIMTFSKFGTPTKPLFEKLKIFHFKKIVFLRITLQMYKYNHGLFPIAFTTMFVKKINTIITIQGTKTNYDHRLVNTHIETNTLVS